MYRPNRVSIRSFQRAEVDKSKDPQFWSAFDARVDALAAKREAQKPENWPQSRQLAILMIARTELAKQCIAKLSGSDVRPRQHDFLYLRNHEFATKELGDRYHQMTKCGWKAAETCAWSLAKALGLHHLQCHFDSWSEHKGRCPCGWTASVNRRSNTRWRERLEREFERHLVNPDAWKTAGEASRAVIDDLFPRRGPS